MYGEFGQNILTDQVRDNLWGYMYLS